jgi:hypothetical protein
MTTYRVRFVHKIAPRDTDVKNDVAIPDGAFSDRKVLAAALRKAGVLHSGGRLQSFRVAGDKVIAFPCASIWNAFVLTPEETT